MDRTHSTPAGAPAAPSRKRRAPSVTTVAWNAETELDFAEWIQHGRRIGVAGRSAGWWIGDWVRYGAVRYGAKYARAARVTGYDHQTLMNMVYVASRFEIYRRRENLSWSHHAEVASFDVEEQEHWLQRASEERLSVRKLRQRIAEEPGSGRASARTSENSEERARSPDGTPLGEAGDGHEVVCPQCGYQVVCTHCGYHATPGATHETAHGATPRAA